jgi:hypothetical protein
MTTSILRWMQFANLFTSLMAIAACSSHPGFPNGGPDAAPGDTLSPTGDAGPNAVGVTVTAHGAPAPGVVVYFQNADSSLVLGAVTDASGSASAALSAGGYVTVIEPDDGSGATRLATFAAVAPGDALHLDLSPAGSTDSVDVAITVPVLAGAASYQLDTSCGQLSAGASGAAAGSLLGCGGTADVLVVALDAQGSVLDSLYAPGVSLAAQPAVVTGSYGALVATSFAYSGIPATSSAVRTDEILATARGSLFEVSTSGPVDAGRITNALILPAGGTIAITVSDAQPASSDFGEQRVFDWGSPGAPYALDFAAALLPSFAAAPAYDPATRDVSWSELTAAESANLVRARVHAFRDALPEGRAWTWSIVAPRVEAPIVALPRFPPGGFDFTPQAGDAIDVDELLIARVPHGYDGVRAHGFDDVQRYVTGPSGRLVVETLYSPPL